MCVCGGGGGGQRCNIKLHMNILNKNGSATFVSLMFSLLSKGLHSELIKSIFMAITYILDPTAVH